MKKIFTLTTVSAILFLSTSAQRLLTEDFNYAAGQLSAAAGGANVSGGVWDSISGNAKFIQVVSSNLSYSGYITSPSVDSRAIALDTATSSAEDVKADFTAQTSGTVYASLLLNMLSDAQLNENSADTAEYFVGLLPGTNTSSYVSRLFARKGSVAGTFNLGIAATSYRTTPIQWTGIDYSIAATHLVTIGYQINAGTANDVAQLWVDAPYSATEPIADAFSVIIGSEPGDIGRIAFRQGGSTSGGLGSTPKCEIDAIKISTTWADATLPVTLKSFTANNQNGTINLNWTTVNEINMKEYVIERSIDAKNFTGIGIMAAKNSPIENNYGYADLKALNGTSYYRLKMVDNDGAYRYSIIIPGSAKILQRLMVLGGVVNSNLIINHAVAGNGAILKIISMNGNVTAIQHIQTGASQTVMDVSKLASGNYIAMFINGNEKQTVQFVKQ